MDIDVQGKTVLEIGFGGGWYLAQILQHGDAKVIGFEASQTAIQKTHELMELLRLQNYELFRVDERYFDILPANTIDIIFQTSISI